MYSASMYQVGLENKTSFMCNLQNKKTHFNSYRIYIISLLALREEKRMQNFGE